MNKAILFSKESFLKRGGVINPNSILCFKGVLRGSYPFVEAVVLGFPLFVEGYLRDFYLFE